MSFLSHQKLYLILLLWPLLGGLGLIAYQEVMVRQSQEFVEPIAGYDPRDLLRGHYLRFTFAADADSDFRDRRGPFEYDVPETVANRLTQLLRENRGKVAIGVYRRPDGTLSFDELYIEGKRWQDYVATQESH